ncbi:SGNH/GDSL hydrolase family protein [Micromonospora parathelypteridis]|uniref:Lysophospholipase L1-like esterase n=1 Tax=Micromonospora parathelypteridis TaxID=1839617 RepID=A0A840VUH5_9ACTN|nr:SGNH/GDSL hydrolase family protein [Micromonospora parathelypteridis]MBB5480973.1 lysophospholipase L1-like esterase [Micromonospora parathelypteridis]
MQLVAMGDSLTLGRGDPDPAGGWIGWSRRLAGLLGIAADEVVNTGSEGATTAEVAAGQLAAVRQLRPDLVVINCGMNDAVQGTPLSTVRTALTDLFTWGTKAGALVLMPALPTPSAKLPVSTFRRRRMERWIAEFDDLLRADAARGLVVRVEVAPAEAESMWSDDGIHLNTAGHVRVATVLADTARRMSPTVAAAGGDTAS